MFDFRSLHYVTLAFPSVGREQLIYHTNEIYLTLREYFRWFSNAFFFSNEMKVSLYMVVISLNKMYPFVSLIFRVALSYLAFPNVGHQQLLSHTNKKTTWKMVSLILKAMFFKWMKVSLYVVDIVVISLNTTQRRLIHKLTQSTLIYSNPTPIHSIIEYSMHFFMLSLTYQGYPRKL